MDKARLRSELKQRLALITPDQRSEKSRAITQFVLEAEPFKKASVVMMFLSLPHEVDTTSMILAAWQQGKTVVVPMMSWEHHHMIPVEINSLDTGLKQDRMGLRNPIAGEPVPFEDIDMVVTPGLGFDRQGNRLGRGAAYYDRFFASHNLRAAKWAVGFSEQLCPAIPHDDTDVPVDAVVTEQEIIICSK